MSDYYWSIEIPPPFAKPKDMSGDWWLQALPSCEKHRRTGGLRLATENIWRSLWETGSSGLVEPKCNGFRERRHPHPSTALWTQADWDSLSKCWAHTWFHYSDRKYWTYDQHRHPLQRTVSTHCSLPFLWTNTLSVDSLVHRSQWPARFASGLTLFL